MSTTAVEFKISKKPKTILVEFNSAQFEKVAGIFGMFNPDFLKSLARSEAQFRKGQVRKIKSLAELM
ncbi:MAG: hypothetical protein Q7K40_04180 [bacterium]|nr:hypothetical protein [bacterium]